MPATRVARIYYLLKFESQNTERVGNYVVTSLVKSISSGEFLAAVSIRRGMYDRVFRFANCFPTSALAMQHALAEGKGMVLANELN